MQGILNNLAALWSLLVLLAVVAALLWFFYRAFLRKIIRMRKISNIRSRREMREAVERGLSRNNHDIDA